MKRSSPILKYLLEYLAQSPSDEIKVKDLFKVLSREFLASYSTTYAYVMRLNAMGVLIRKEHGVYIINKEMAKTYLEKLTSEAQGE